jgi:hypothetical protein
LFLHQTPGFVSVLFFFEINDCYISAFFCKGDRDCATNPTVAPGNERDLVLQLPAAALFFIVGSRPRLHFMFTARLALLMLRRLKLLSFGHKSSVGRRPSLYNQRRLRVRAAFFAAAERDRAERCLATRFEWRDKADREADRRLSRLRARLVARERLADGFLRRAARPFARSRRA